MWIKTALTFLFLFGVSSSLPVGETSIPHHVPKLVHPIIPISKARTEVPEDFVNILRNVDPNSPEFRGLIGNMIQVLAKGYQGLINRQQQVLDYVYCEDCIEPSPVQTFLNALSNVPVLGWAVRSGVQVDKPPATFITATHMDGIVTGAGGSVVDDKPLVEYTFQTPVKPVETKQYSRSDALPFIPALRAPNFGMADAMS